MSESFDAYYIWLGIPPEEQPANHYRLLGIKLFEANANVIENAADRAMAQLRTFQSGAHSAVSQRLLNEVTQAKLCLLTPERRADYDALLRATLSSVNVADVVPGFDPSSIASQVFQSSSEPADPEQYTTSHTAPHHKKVNRGLLLSAAVGGIVLLLVLAVAAMALRGGSKPTAKGKPAMPQLAKKIASAPAASPNASAPSTKSPERMDLPRVPPSVANSATAETASPSPSVQAAKQINRPAKEPGPSAARSKAPDPIASASTMTSAEQPRPGTQPTKTPISYAHLAAGKWEKLVTTQTDLDSTAFGKRGVKLDSDGTITLSDNGCWFPKLHQDQAIRARVTFLGGQVVILNLRNSGDGNCYQAALGGKAIFIGRLTRKGNASPTLDVLVTAPCQRNANSDNELCFVAIGNVLQLYFDGVLLVEARDAAYSSGGVGIYAYQATGQLRQLEYLNLDGLTRPPVASSLSAAIPATSLSDQSGPAASNVGSKPLPPLAVAPFDATQAKEHQRRWSEYLGIPIEITNSIGMKLVLIPPSEFDMGSSPEEIRQVDEGSRADGMTPETDKWHFLRLPTEGPKHRIKLSRPYYIAVREVTEEEYKYVMNITPTAASQEPNEPDTAPQPVGSLPRVGQEEVGQKTSGQSTSQRPVQFVSWKDAWEFCERLSAIPKERQPNRKYDLPTEAQWECACRAGAPSVWGGSYERNDLVQYAWFGGKHGDSKGNPHTVGEKNPNQFGLYDMLGNVWEWCADWYGSAYYKESPPVDPAGPFAGSSRAQRGGCWFDPVWSSRPASRCGSPPGRRSSGIGFRVVWVIPDASLDIASLPPAAQDPVAIAKNPSSQQFLPPDQQAVATKETIPAGDSPPSQPVAGGQSAVVAPKPSVISTQSEPLAKLSIPDEASLAKTLEQSQRLFKDEYDKAQTPAALTELAKRTLLKAAEVQADARTRFVFLRLARDVAAKAGDSKTAFEAIDLLAESFAIDPWEMKASVLSNALKQPGKAPERAQIAEDILSLMRQSLEHDVLEVAERMAKLALAEGVRLRDKEITTAANLGVKDVRQATKAFAPVGAALATLKQNPGDPEANLTVGRYQCFVKGDWSNGLKLLAQSGDATLKAMAEKEVSSASGQSATVAPLELGDGWWDLAQESDAKYKDQILRRAGHWYRKANDGIAAAEKVRVDARMETIAKLGADASAAEQGASSAKERLPSRRKNIGTPTFRNMEFTYWQVVGPFSYGTFDEAFDAAHPIEAAPVDVSRTYQDRFGKREWRPFQSPAKDVNVVQAVGPPSPGTVGVYYAACWVRFPGDLNNYRIYLGFSCAHKYANNGRLCCGKVRSDSWGGVSPTSSYAGFKAGWNELLVKLVVPSDGQTRPEFHFEASAPQDQFGRQLQVEVPEIRLVRPK